MFRAEEYDVEDILKEFKGHLETLRTRESFERFLAEALKMNFAEHKEARRKQIEIAEKRVEDFGESYAKESKRRLDAQRDAEATLESLGPALHLFKDGKYDVDGTVSIARKLLNHEAVSVRENALRNLMHIRMLASSPVVNPTVAEERDDCVRRLENAHAEHILKKPKTGSYEGQPRKRPLA
jgi:hypothetical protein